MSQQERGQADKTKIQQIVSQPVSSESREAEEIVQAQQKIEPVKRQFAQITQSETQQPKGYSQKVQKVQSMNVTRASLPPINNLKYEYKGHQKYDWDIGMLDGSSCLQKMQSNKLPDFHEFCFENEVDIVITLVNNVKGHLFYTLDVKDKKGQREVSRRYTQFIAWRSKLAELWPGIIFETFPNKTLIGVSEADLITNRSQYINRFLRSLSRHQAIYYSEQSQTFLNSTQDNNLQAYLLSIPAPKNADIFERYKTAFPTQYELSLKEDFLYRKDEIAISLQAYEAFFLNKKVDLSEYLQRIRKMAESKQRYFKALNKLSLSLLPSYEDLIYRWIHGQALPKSLPSIMERMSLKNLQSEQKPENKAIQGEPRQRKLSKQLQKQPQEPKFGLFSSEAYKSRFEDTTNEIEDYNASNWKFYNVFKFELKEIDSVVGAIQQIKSVGRKIEHLKRTISINKKQVEALNSNKTTLKTFFIGGDKDEKKLKLTNQNQATQQSLQKLQEFYYLLSVLLQHQIEKYNEERAHFYKNSLKKAFNEELSISRKIMDFYVFEEQLLNKEIQQRVKFLRESANSSKQAQAQVSVQAEK